MVRVGQKVRLPRRMSFPLIVKSLTQEASIGISQASIVEDEAKLKERVQFIHESIGTDAIVEQFIDGRELYCGIIGNERLQVFPVWEMSFTRMGDRTHRIATEKVKWSPSYQKKVGISIMNHPGSFRYPSDWHVRAYGLFAANPWILKGENTLAKGESLTLKWRVYVHGGAAAAGKVADVFAGYANAQATAE
jgi:hypothetical protein